MKKLIAITALVFATVDSPAAKLCAYNPPAEYSATQPNSFNCNFDANNPRFNLGVGCGGTASSLWETMPRTGACTQTLAGGSIKCETGKCYCRLTYPYVSNWVYTVDFSASRNDVCKYQCGCYCGLQFANKSISYGSMFY